MSAVASSPDRDVITALLGARLRAAMARPYLATSLFSMTPIVNERVPTMAVDGAWRCHANPDFVRSTPAAALAALWVHHVSHLLRGHAERAAHRDERDTDELINLAQDLEINDDLEGEGLWLPDDAPRPATYALPVGRLYEQYARTLRELEGIEQLQQLGDCGSGAHGSARDWEPDLEGTNGDGEHEVPSGLSPVEADLVKQETANQIAEHGDLRGAVPDSWVRWAEATGQSGSDWRSALRSAVRVSVGTVSGRTDYSYQRLSRRASAAIGGRGGWSAEGFGVVLPAMVSRLPRVGIVVDTSGSMGEVQLDAALTEVQGVLRSGGVRDDDVTIFATDAAVHWFGRIRDIGGVELLGGGGTDLRVGISEAIGPPHRSDVVIVLTDGQTPWPAEEPAVPVVVGLLVGAVPSSEQAPAEPPGWAATIRIPRLVGVVDEQMS